MVGVEERCQRANSFMKPAGGRGGVRNVAALPVERAIASAAMRPLRTAPSMVEGQPERVQSPAR